MNDFYNAVAGFLMGVALLASFAVPLFVLEHLRIGPTKWVVIGVLIAVLIGLEIVFKHVD